MIKINDLIWTHKPLGSVYKVFDIKEYWIPNDSGQEILEYKPVNVQDYWLSRILYYTHYSNNTGKILKGKEPTHCSEKRVFLYDKKKVLDYHQKKIDKLRAIANPTEKEEKEIEKMAGYMKVVLANL